MPSDISRRAIKSLQRTVVLSSDGHLNQRDLRIVTADIATLNDSIHNSIRRLRDMPELSELMVPTVTLSVAEVALSDGPIFETLDRAVDSGIEGIRVIVGTEPDSASTRDLEIIDSVSHLVICSCEPGTNEQWYELPPAPLSGVRVRSWKIAHLLHDVALDIALFHAGPRISRMFGNSVEGKREYSALKVQFIRETASQSFFGDLDPALSYVCLSAAVREDENLDLRKYVHAWQQFVRFVHTSLPGRWEAAENNLQRSQSFEDFWSSLPFRKELSPRKVEKAYRSLESGYWWFVITRRRPRGYKADALASLMAKRRWNRNSWRFVADGDESIFNKFSEWLDFVGPLEVP
jgi:hypothetical protein